MEKIKKRGRKPKNSQKSSANSVTSNPKQKCKRGYKFCKGENCDEMLNIHQKVCQKCGYANTMKKKKEDKEKIKELLFKKVDQNKKKHITKGQLRKLKLFIENDIFSVIFFIQFLNNVFPIG